MLSSLILNGRMAAAGRPGLREAREYWHGMRFRREAMGWREQERLSWQWTRLAEALRDAVASSPFWRERINAAGIDLTQPMDAAAYRRLVPIDKEVLRSEAERIRSVPEGAPGTTRDATGGSTGEPVNIWLGPRERAWRRSGSDWSMTRIGVPPGAKRALLWGHHLDPVHRKGWRDRAVDVLLARRWLDCFRADEARYRAYDDEIRAWQPDAIVAYARALGDLARAARVPATYPRVACVTGAEKLTAADRASAERAFGVPVYERYGARDIGDMAFQYAVPASLHFETDWALVLLEVEEDANEAPLLVTKLQADAFPMFRYRIGDTVRTTPASRAGGSVLRLEEVTGRTTDRIRLRDGGSLHGITFPHLFKDFPVRAFQVHQASDYAVTVRLVTTRALQEHERSRMSSILSANLPGMPLSIEEVAELQLTTAGKLRPVISEVIS